MRKSRRKKIGWGSVVYLIFLILFGYLLWSKWTDVVRIFSSLQQANVWWLILALLVQILIIVNQAMFYADCYQAFGLRIGWWRFFNLLPAANFMSMVSPSGGFVAGISLLFLDGYRLNLPKAKLVLANVIYWVVYYLVYLFFLLIGLGYLVLHRQLKDYVLVAALIMFAIVFIVIVVAVLSLDNYERFKVAVLKGVDYLNRINRWLNRDKKIDERIVKRYSYEIFDGYHLAINNLQRFKKLVYRAGSQILLNTALLMVLVWSLGGDGGKFAVLLSCYVVAALLMVISITPSGAGVVELAMVGILATSLLDFDRAVLIVVLYRLFQFWLPLILGFVSFRRLNIFRKT